MTLTIKGLSQEEIDRRAAMHPEELRRLIKQREWEPDSTYSQFYSSGYIQTAVDIVPLDYAFEFLLFCIRNPRSSYVIDVCEPGSPHPLLLAPDADVRTDCHKYRVYKYGEVIDEPSDIMKYWRDDLVAFFLNCSWGFEGVLRDRNVQFLYLAAFETNIPCVPAGRFRDCNLVVSTRSFPTSLDAVRAIQITSQLPVSHGYPIHIGDPIEIGYDLRRPHSPKPGEIYYNPFHPDPPPLHPGEIYMSWACGDTTENAIKAAKVPLAITHHPAHVFVGDRRTEEFHSSFTT